MAIVCGTDFSPSSRRAVRVAALLGSRLHEPLALLHVVDWMHSELLGVTALEVDPVRERLHQVAEHIRRRGVEVKEEISSGAPDEVLVDRAGQTGVRLLVVAALGRRPPARWLLGSVAERTAQTSPVPVLVVRQTTGFRRWAMGRQPLRVVVGADLSGPAEAALGWVRELARLGPCDLVVAHAYAPAAERRRLGIGGPLESPAEPHPEVERVLLRELAAKAGVLPGESRVRFRVAAARERVAEHLVRVAVEESADVLVVGTHRRRGTSRLWHGSVSNAVLRLAPMSVLSVPVVDGRGPVAIPALRRVLVPTDFSELGNSAVAHAYAPLTAGGTVHIIHVIEEAAVQRLAYPLYETGWPPTPEQRAAQEPELVARLRALIPDEAEARGIETRVEVVEGRDAADAICAAAERLGVDLVCLASHGRSGLASTLAGSVSRRVLARSPRPVMVIGACDRG